MYSPKLFMPTQGKELDLYACPGLAWSVDFSTWPVLLPFFSESGVSNLAVDYGMN